MGLTAKKRARRAFEKRVVAPRQLPTVRRAHREIEQPIRLESQPVRTAIIRVAEAAEYDLTLVRTPVAVRVSERDGVRRIGEIRPVAAPCEAHRESHSLRKNRPFSNRPSPSSSSSRETRQSFARSRKPA